MYIYYIFHIPYYILYIIYISYCTYVQFYIYWIEGWGCIHRIPGYPLHWMGGDYPPVHLELSMAMGVPPSSLVSVRENPNLKWMMSGGTPMT